MNPRFPVLSIVSKLLRKFGWAAVALACFYGVKEGIVEPLLPGHRFAEHDAFQFVSGLAGAIVGLIIVAWGEIIGVLFAIEENTRPRMGS